MAGEPRRQSRPIITLTPAALVDDETRAMPSALSNRTGLSGVVEKTVGSRPSNNAKLWAILTLSCGMRAAVAASLTSRRTPDVDRHALPRVCPEQVGADADEDYEQSADGDGQQARHDLIGRAQPRQIVGSPQWRKGGA